MAVPVHLRISSVCQRLCVVSVRYSTVTQNVELTDDSLRKIEDTETSNQHVNSGIPLVPKRRDPDAVLKALASTVTSLKDPFIMGRCLADPFTPRNRRQMMDYVMAQEAGRKAAEYVIYRYPELFPGRQPVPDLRPVRPQWKGMNEESLKDLIRAQKSEKALDLFKKLQEKGEMISLGTQNGLLALLAYMGVGNIPDQDLKEETIKEEEIPESVVEDIEDKVLTNEEEKNEKTDVGRASKLKYYKETNSRQSTLKWSNENYAEKLFAEMSEKDGGTYGAMIRGLVRHREHTRALEMFQEARQQGQQLSLATYNSLLRGMNDTEDQKTWKVAKGVIAEMENSPLVKPDIATINLLLQLACGTGTGSREHAMEVIREMKFLDIKPNLTTYMLLLKSFMSQADGSILYSIIKYIEENPEILSINEFTDVDFFPMAMSGARLLKDPELAMRIKNLVMKNQWYLVSGIEGFLSHYLFTVSHQLDMDSLMREYNEVVPNLFVPKEWLYSYLFRKCEQNATPDIALKLWQDMMKYRVDIKDLEVINKLMGAFSRANDSLSFELYVSPLKDIWKRIEYLEIQPTPVIISITIKLLTLNNQMEEAWSYYHLFNKYNIKPTFSALSSLLKAHYGYRDSAKVAELFEIMITHGYFLPLTYVRDICWRVDIPSHQRSQFLERFLKNKPAEHKNIDLEPENQNQNKTTDENNLNK